MRPLTSTCYSIFHCPYAIHRELQNRFSWNLIMGSFIKVCRRIIILVKINKNVSDTLHEFRGASRVRLAEYFTRIWKKNVSNKCREKLGTTELPNTSSVTLTIYGILKQGTSLRSLQAKPGEYVGNITLCLNILPFQFVTFNRKEPG
jgi:hypothetical protein